jgi:hypothetical protein
MTAWGNRLKVMLIEELNAWDEGHEGAQRCRDVSDTTALYVGTRDPDYSGRFLDGCNRLWLTIVREYDPLRGQSDFI